MNPIRQMVILFHGLAGLSIGFFTATAGVWVRAILAAGGCAFGLIAALMMCYMPGMILSAAGTIRHNRGLTVLLSLCAHLVWIGVAVSFWWICIVLFLTNSGS